MQCFQEKLLKQLLIKDKTVFNFTHDDYDRKKGLQITFVKLLHSLHKI